MDKTDRPDRFRLTGNQGKEDRIVDARYRDLLWICENLRERDRQEIFALQHVDDARAVADRAYCSPLSRVGLASDGEPAVAFGAFELWPGVWSVFLFGTDRFRDAGWFVARHIRARVLPLLLGAGAHRAQCYALVGHNSAEDFIRRMGGKEEAYLEGFGRDGEDFRLFRWLRTDVRNGMR